MVKTTEIFYDKIVAMNPKVDNIENYPLQWEATVGLLKDWIRPLEKITSHNTFSDSGFQDRLIWHFCFDRSLTVSSPNQGFT